ncbi:MAG: alpha/beta hydrolase family protein, partial [Ardenticatenaceae bacterium]
MSLIARMILRLPFLLALLALSVACSGNSAARPTSTNPATGAAVAVSTATIAPTFTRPPAPSASVTARERPPSVTVPSSTSTPHTSEQDARSTSHTPTATPDPFTPYYIETFTTRGFGEGAIEVGELLEETDTFRRFAFTYPSDGLRVTGYLNLPRGEGPFPVIILNHGYYFFDHYDQGDGTQAAADYLAQRGYLTLASNYRSYAGSDPGPNPFRFGYVIDVMN